MIFTQPVQHFPPELPLLFSAYFRKVSGCLGFHSNQHTQVKCVPGCGAFILPGISLDQHVTKGFFLFTATVEKGFVWTHAVMMPPCLTSLLCLFWFLRQKWFLPFPANLWAELCFIHFTLGCAVFSLYMMGDIWGPASSEQPTRSSMLFWNHPPTSLPSFLNYPGLDG